MSPKITIREVAERAGVATMTVSRVLNRKGYVSAAVRERVLRAVEDLGYVPNHLARGLRVQRTGTIALMVTDITNPFFTTVARGVEDAASDAGLLVLFCNTDESEEEESRYVRLLLEKRVDGILLVPARAGSEALGLAAKNRTPVVVLDRRIGESGAVDVVRCDSYSGGYQLGRLLVELGHRRFAILAGPEGVSTSDDRVEGFMSALGGRPAEIFHGEFRQESGMDMAESALLFNPTAIFAANNFQMIGALRRLRSTGLRIPEDVSLVGFDDLPESFVSDPFLTVVRQPAYEMGEQAVELLLQRLKEPTKEPQEVVLPTEILIRKSSSRWG